MHASLPLPVFFIILLSPQNIPHNKKSPNFSVETTLFSYFHYHQAVVSAFQPPLTAQRIASSAISFRLPPASISAAASFRLTLVFCFRFRRSLGLPFHGLSPLPFRFLTPAVSAFFRPPQFWILTTQPLFFLSFSSRFCLTVAFPVPVSTLASSVSSFSPA